VEDLKGLVEELEQEQQMSLINVELVDDELARVYANSNKAQVTHCYSAIFLTFLMIFAVCMCMWSEMYVFIAVETNYLNSDIFVSKIKVVLILVSCMRKKFVLK